jgi:hypothetical protein
MTGFLIFTKWKFVKNYSITEFTNRLLMKETRKVTESNKLNTLILHTFIQLYLKSLTLLMLYFDIN